NFAAADQYLAIIFPSKMYQKAYDDRGLDRRVLSRALEDGGTLTSALFPWNTCGAFLFGVLGVSPFVYGPYAIFNWLSPLISIFFGFTGYRILYKRKLGKI
ncbi:MAG: Na+/H+ antiporter NhaC, partial [Tissierellia bacterium]|nr:Na+/H+ antiporter NhaC [Tissierellia bacterium]